MTRSIEVHIGETLDDMGRRLVDAWKRAEAGEDVDEDHLTFESWRALTTHIPSGGIALLRAIESHPSHDERMLARMLGRDPGAVAADIQMLTAIGLLDETPDGVHIVRLKMPRSA